MTKTSFLLLGFCLLATAPARAAMSPLSLGLAHTIEFPAEDFSVTGLRLSILWAEHRAMYGVDLGVLGNITEQEFAGLAVSGVFNNTQGSASIVGLQLAGITNMNSGKVRLYGFQLAGAVNSNQGESTGTGIQAALLANLSPHMTLNGLQVGLYNRAHDIRGLQIGLINVTDNLHGFQIGLLNYNRQGLFSVAPILNADF